MRHKDSLTAQAMATAWRRQNHYPIGGQPHLGRPPQPSPEAWTAMFGSIGKHLH
jgi:hypothetical protein